MRVLESSEDWVVIGRDVGMRELAFQRVADYRPPRWPGTEHPQQLHLDIRVDSVDEAEALSVSLGAERAPGPETPRQTVAGPSSWAGHPFCLVFGASPVQDARFGFDTTRQGS